MMALVSSSSNPSGARKRIERKRNDREPSKIGRPSIEQGHHLWEVSVSSSLHHETEVSESIQHGSLVGRVYPQDDFRSDLSVIYCCGH